MPTTWEDGFKVTVDRLEAARTARTKVLLFVSPSNPTGAVYPPGEVEAIGRWAVDHGIWVVTDEIYEHLVYGEARVLVDAGARSRAGRHLRGDQRRGQDLRHDGVAGGLDDRPSRRDRSGRQPAVPRHLQRVQRGPAGGPGRRERGPRGRGRDAVGLRPAPPHHRRHAQRHPRRALPRAPRRVLRLPERGRTAGAAVRRPDGVDVARAGRRSCSSGPRWRSCRARRSAPRVTPDFPMPSATRRWRRGSPAWPSSSPVDGRRGTGTDHRGDRRAGPGAAARRRAPGRRVDRAVGGGAAGRDRVGRGPDHPLGHPGDRAPCSRPRPTWWWSAGPASGSTTSTWPPPPAAG